MRRGGNCSDGHLCARFEFDYPLTKANSASMLRLYPFPCNDYSILLIMKLIQMNVLRRLELSICGRHQREGKREICSEGLSKSVPRTDVGS